MNHYLIARERCDSLKNLMQWQLFDEQVGTEVLLGEEMTPAFYSFAPGHKVSVLIAYSDWLPLGFSISPFK